MRLTIILVTLALFSCSVEPEPLRLGKDQCHFCKMTLMDGKFGAELVTTKSKVYKFDDINCLFNFYNEGSVNKDDYRFKLVVDFSQPKKLINAEEARYLMSPKIKSPMASQVAAFESAPSELVTQWTATEYGWNDLHNLFQK